MFTLFLLVLLSGCCSSSPSVVVLSSPLSTVALSRAAGQTLVCALLPAPCRTRYDLNCTALPSGVRRSYSSGAATYSAIAAGDDFLCGLAALPSSNLSSMRWWEFALNSSRISKRVYQGPPLAALAAGDSHVCGVLAATGRLKCWRWPLFAFRPVLKVLEIAVGGDFVCALLTSGAVRCLGSDAGVAGKEPAGNYTTVAAGKRHACAVSTDGALACWGVGAPTARVPGVSALAVGDNRTCALRANNGTVVCWGGDIVVPSDVAGAQFMAIQAKGDDFCGILMVNYSLVCWGSEVFDRNRMVFNQVLPGSCEPISSCPCGVLPGSGDICVAGVICLPCRLVVRPNPPQSPSNSSARRRRSGGGKKRLVLLAVGAAGLSFCLAAAGSYFLFQLYKKSGRVHDSGRLGDVATPAAATEDLPEYSEPPVGRQLSPLLSKRHGSFVEEFPLDVLLEATGGFAEECKIGSGSFGSVYRATLADGREVAIKRADWPLLSAPSSSSRAASVRKRRRDKEAAFVSELALLSRVNHKNLVRLFGYCHEGEERVLVYEFMANGTLHHHLHRLAGSPLASWRARLRAALDAARGLEYLHVYAVPPIIHRDIKSSNILLDESWTAKVADFGLSLLNPDDEDGTPESDGAATRAAGTVGYMDPEYYRLQHLTAKSDVYSFGVVLLELLTGSKVIQRYEESATPRNVVEHAVPHIEADAVHRVLDARLPPPTPSEIEAVAYVGYLAADCVSPAGRDRPTMSDAVAALERALAACDPPALARSATTRSV